MMKFTQVSLAVLALALVAMPVQAESLTEAVQTTVVSHPKIGVVANDRRAIDEELNQAFGLFRPQVDFRGDMGAAWSNRWGPADAQDDGDILPNAAAQLTLQQMLFDGYNASAEVERQENRIRSAAHRVRETGEFVGLDAVEAYLNVLRSRQLLELANQNVADHGGRLEDITRRERGGAGNMADVRQADARLAQAQANRAQVEGDLRQAESRYNSIVGRFPTDLTRPQVPMAYMPADEQAAVDAALADSPTIHIRDTDIDVANAELTQTRASFYPQVNLEGNASRQKDIGGLRTTKDEVGAGLVMRWNLYRGGADVARSEEFTWRRAEAQSQLDDAKREVEERVRSAWAARESARQRAELFASQVTANESVLGSYLKQFDAGERTLLDVLDAQNELFLSRSNMITAYYTALFGDYQVLAERGALLASLDITPVAAASVVSDEQQSR